jgi:hypothetical protein
MAYLDAVNESDVDAVLELADPAAGARDEARSRVERLGGHRLYYQDMRFHGAGMAGLTSVDLDLRSGNAGDTTVYHDALSLALTDSRWHLLLGQPR